MPLHAQQSVNASGGEALGPAGAVSFSVGQIEYTAHEGPVGRVYLGVQQPYTEGPSEPPLPVAPCFLYPNPASTLLFFDLPTADELLVQITIYDVRGLIVRELSQWDRKEGIPLEGIPSGAYWVRLRDAEGKSHVCRFLKTQ